VIAEHYERGGDRQRAALCYLQAAEDALARGNTLAALGQVDRGLLCAPDDKLLNQLRGIEGYLAFLLDRNDRMNQAAALAIEHLRAGSLGWCRAMSPAIFATINNRAGSRAMALVSQLLGTEPDVDAHAAYVAALAGVLQLLIKLVPAALVQSFLDRLAAIAERSGPSNLVVWRYLNIVRGVAAIFRWPRPYTLVQQFQRALQLCDVAGELRDRTYITGGYLEWGYLELGDIAGAQHRLLALADTMERSEESLAVNMWRHLLGRALTLSPTEAHWRQAEQVVAPLLAQAGGHPSYPFHARTVMARLSLLRGNLEDAAEQARAAMEFFLSMPIYLAHVAPVRIHALLGLGQTTAALAVAEQVLTLLRSHDGLGIAEVECRLAASEALYAARAYERAHTELGETLRQIQLRVDDITDPFWRQSYVTRNPYCVRAYRLATEWNVASSSTQQ
jgi:hypothetical protein